MAEAVRSPLGSAFAALVGRGRKRDLAQLLGATGCDQPEVTLAPVGGRVSDREENQLAIGR